MSNNSKKYSMLIRIFCGLFGIGFLLTAFVFLRMTIEQDWWRIFNVFVSLWAMRIFLSAAYHGVAPAWFEETKLTNPLKKK